ncbi:MAG: N(6)-L-threonylcarbamoyladenine synthase, TsaD subunit [Candidatus Westeberhardia cardiocondylae]|nr:N(6)-L-threonylcarbamoyladenine synthase, TsaD subunit [Candidatus Westeberhardia cardiocondylae]
MIRILGIETSCDDTGIAIYDKKHGLLSNKIYKQNYLNTRHGGIIPELASRAHINKIIPLIQSALKDAQSKIQNIDAIAYTAGPGLSGPLIIGATTGKTLGYIYNIPSIPINHMEGHLLSPMLKIPELSFPLIALLISGGHTQLIAVKNIGEYKILGESTDDAVGETYDKIAKLLGLTYPGGKSLSILAKQGIPKTYIFPKPMTKKEGLQFSFSGLKTYVTNIIQKSPKNIQTKANIALAFEESVIDTFIIKCKRALKITKFNNLLLAGGVSANKKLRKKLTKIMQKKMGKIFIAPTRFCTDNGAMIAYVGMLRFQKNIKNDLKISINTNWSLEELSPIKHKKHSCNIII